MSRGFHHADLDPRLAQALARLDVLVDLERADRSAGTAGADAIRRVDLGPIRDLMERLGHPERAFRAAHVAGTKGKGSVAAFIAAGLAGAGHRVGLYTSPHVERVHERVWIEGSPIGDRPLAQHLERAMDARDAAVREASAGRDATWFDTLTAAAFDAFRGAGLDWAVIEVGLGGRLDSTNVVDGEVCVVTNIELEHTAILGETRAAIAAEKAGIFQAGAACLTGVPASDTEVAPVLARAAEAVGREVAFHALSGTIRERNRALARAALDALAARGVAVADRSEPWSLPGRMERRRVDGVHVLLDGAHVPSSLEAVLAEAEADSSLPGAPTAVLALARDKDARGLLKALRGRVDRVVCTSTGVGTARSPGELLQWATELGVEAESVPDPRDALRAALRRAQPAGWVLVTGSLHLIGAVRGHLPPEP